MSGVTAVIVSPEEVDLCCLVGEIVETATDQELVLEEETRIHKRSTQI
jgi:hypothetical protein